MIRKVKNRGRKKKEVSILKGKGINTDLGATTGVPALKI